MYVKVTRTPKGTDQIQQVKLRLPYPRPIPNPKEIKSIIVEMTQASSEFMPKKEKQAA